MIIIKDENRELEFTSTLFPGGEVGVRLNTEAYRFWNSNGVITLVARLGSSTSIMELIMIVDALRQVDEFRPIRLVMPYVPYGRQDRVCNPGESLGVKAFANIINGLLFEGVVILDPHSDVSGAVIDRVKIIEQITIIGAFDEFNLFMSSGHPRFVSPDAGAIKKTEKLAAYFGHENYVRANKRRDLSTGNIVETVVDEDVEGMELVIADDICDGGRTFIELAKILKGKGARSVSLYVTHGIFSKGTKPLYDAGIDNIFTTDSFYKTWPHDVSHKVVTLPISRLIK